MKILATYDTIKKLVKYLKTDFLAPKAKQLNKARAISLTGDITGSATFDGTADVNINSQSSIFRQPNTSYQVGDTVYIKGCGVKYRLSCVTAGTTSTNELDDVSSSTPIEKGLSFDNTRFSYERIYANDGTIKLTANAPIGIALVATGGGAGTWAQVDAKGDALA